MSRLHLVLWRPCLHNINSSVQTIMDTNLSSLLQPVCVEGQVILITGASSGIGEAVSVLLAKAGAKVCIAARRTDKLTAVREAIENDGGKAFQYQLDVTNRDQFAKVVEDIEKHVGPIDVLINNAGVMYVSHMHDVMVEDWDRMIEVNCRGVTNGIACVLPWMNERKKGHIVNMSSDLGRRAVPGMTVYSATKFFIEGITQGLRKEVKDKGIRVTSFQPGGCKTEITVDTHDRNALKPCFSHFTGRFMDPKDVARGVLYVLTQPEHVAVNEVLVEPLFLPI